MTKTVTIAATRTNGDPYAHHDVIVTLVAGSAGGVVGSNVIVSQTKVPLNASGQGSIVLATNDVEITSPSTSFYRFTVEGSSPTITRSVRITDALPSTISWTRSGIEVGDPTIPQRDVSSDYVTVPEGAMPGVEAGFPPTTDSLTNYLASIDDAIASGGAVDSVNGQTGTVVLDAADVGAEATGVAAALVDDLSGVTNASTARTNLGLGGAAVLAVGTSAGTVAAGDDARFSAGGAVHDVTRSAYLWTASTVGAQWTVEPGSSVFGGRTSFSSAIDGAYFEWIVWIEAGTWTLEYWYLTGASYGITRLSLDGTALGADIDTYTASTVRNNRATRTGIVVATSGTHTVKALTSGKHASSSGYQIGAHGFDLRRTS